MSMASLQIRSDFAMKTVYPEFKGKVLFLTFLDFKLHIRDCGPLADKKWSWHIINKLCYLLEQKN